MIDVYECFLVHCSFDFAGWMGMVLKGHLNRIDIFIGLLIHIVGILAHRSAH